MKKIIKALLEIILIALVCVVIFLFTLVLAYKPYLGLTLFTILILGTIFLFIYYTTGDDNSGK